MESKQEVRCESSGVEEGSVDTSHLKKNCFLSGQEGHVSLRPDWPNSTTTFS